MELKNCPFCDSKARLVTLEEWFYDFFEEYGGAAIEISCTNIDCGCQYWCYSSMHQSDNYETALKVAAERWNHRAEDKKSESL